MSERDIFNAAREMADPVACFAYLDGACGDDAGLRSRIEALLRAHDRTDSLLDQPAFAPQDHDPAIARTVAFESGAAADDEVPLGFLAPATRADSLGRIGHYEVLQVLGQGGFGIVFRAFDDVLHRVVAVKVLSPQMAATSPARKRFLREARSSAAVRHENVVQVYEVGEQPLPYIAMEFIPGETLQQRLDRTGPIDVLEVVRIGRQIAEGLAAAHATDLIHRDIKPGNILLEGGQLRVKITDFGLARAADDASISQSGIIAGTPMFMAPEQAKGESLDQRADLFSFGSVLYQMAAGRPPFRANGMVAVLKRVAEDTPRPIREIIPETPQWLCDIIAKLHAKKPEDRFQSAREVADVLADCEAQLKANSKLKDFSRIPRSKSQPSGRRKWAAAAVLLLPVIALAITEFAGVSHLFQNQHTTRVPIKLASEPAQATLVGKKDTKPVVAAGKQDEQVIDLMPLARPDLARGNWERQGDTLVCTPTFVSNSTLPIPVELPREYELEVELERLALSDFFGLHLAAFGARFHVGVDAFSVQGGWSGLGRIEGKELLENETGIHGLQIIAGKHYILRCMVRATGIRATLDDKLLFHYTGGFEKLSSDAFTDQVHADLYIKVAAHAGFKVHRLRLTRLAPEENTSGSLAEAPSPAIAPSFRTESGTKDKLSSTTIAPSTHADTQRIALLPADELIDQVRKELMRRNPGFDGKLEHKIEGGVVTEFRIVTDQVTDIAPIRVFNALRVLECRGQFTNKSSGLLSDLTPLQGMNLAELTHLNLRDTKVSDAGMVYFKDCTSLTTLILPDTPVGDAGLAHFKNCKALEVLDLGRTRVGNAGLDHFRDFKALTGLWLGTTNVDDAGLSRFRDCKSLTFLDLSVTRVSDAGVANFQDCKALTRLILADTKVSDAGLAHFKNMPLMLLWIHNSGITDLTPLQGMPLEDIRLTPKNITKGLDILRAMKSLKTIGIHWDQAWPAAEFWERYDKGEFKE